MLFRSQNKVNNLSEETIKMVWDLFQQKYNYDEISEETGLSKSKIYRVIEDGKKSNFKTQSEIELERIKSDEKINRIDAKKPQREDNNNQDKKPNEGVYTWYRSQICYAIGVLPQEYGVAM